MYPSVAFRTYKKLKKKNRYRKLLEKVLKTLSVFKTFDLRVNYVHEQVDYHINELIEKDEIKKYITCKKGCGSCCHTQVSITEDESLKYASMIVDEKVEIDWRRLALQAEAKNSGKKYFSIPYELRKCIFLDDLNQCSIYSERPSVCRTNYVVSDPSKCTTFDGVEQPIRLLNTDAADMVVVASFSKSKKSGALPYMIYSILKQLKNI